MSREHVSAPYAPVREMSGPAIVVSRGKTQSGALTTTKTAPTMNSVPEMNTGLAAAGLTLLLGAVAVLRSRRTGGFNA